MGSCQRTPPPGLGPHLVPDVHGPPWSIRGCVAAAKGAVVPPGLWWGWKWLRVNALARAVRARCHLCWGWQRAPPGRGQCGGALQEATGARELGTDQSFSGLAPGLALHALFPGFSRHPLLGGRERAVKEHADNLQSINNTSPYLHSHVSSS